VSKTISLFTSKKAIVKRNIIANRKSQHILHIYMYINIVMYFPYSPFNLSTRGRISAEILKYVLLHTLHSVYQRVFKNEDQAFSVFQVSHFELIDHQRGGRVRGGGRTTMRKPDPL
jgi:hypothetical protein